MKKALDRYQRQGHRRGFPRALANTRRADAEYELRTIWDEAVVRVQDVFDGVQTLSRPEFRDTRLQLVHEQSDGIVAQALRELVFTESPCDVEQLPEYVINASRHRQSVIDRTVHEPRALKDVARQSARIYLSAATSAAALSVIAADLGRRELLSVLRSAFITPTSL